MSVFAPQLATQAKPEDTDRHIHISTLRYVGSNKWWGEGRRSKARAKQGRVTDSSLYIYTT